VGVASPAGVQLNWVDNASTEYQQTLQIVSGATTTLTDLPANLTQYLDPTPLAADTLRSYTVTATGAAGSTKSATFSLAVPNPPGLSAIAQKAGTATMTLTFVDNSKIEKSWVVQQSLDGGVSWSDVAAVASTTGSTVGTRTITVTATSGGSVQYRIAANASTTNVPSTSSAWSAAKAVTIAKVNQTLTFPASLTLGTNATVTSSSALPVTLTTTTPAICTVQGNVITPVAVGTCTITGDQLGSTLWNAATTTTRSLAVSQKTQTITFAPATTLTRPATLTLAATATSGLPVTLTTTTPRICTIAGTVLSGVAAGTCTVTASQLGDATWKAATAVTRSVRIR
jgi:hypothetical protein